MKRLEIHSLEKGYCDMDAIMLHACFQVLVNFIEEEEGLDCHIDWDHDEEHRFAYSEMRELYDWWTAVDRDAVGFDFSSDGEAQKNLERLVKVRMFMWT